MLAAVAKESLLHMFTYPVDTEAESTAISFDLLAKLLSVTRATFNGKEKTLITANGERLPVRSQFSGNHRGKSKSI